MLIESPPNLKLGDDARKVVREQVYYLDPSIRSCTISDRGIELEFDSAPQNPDGLSRKVIDLATRTAKSFEKVRTQQLFAHNGRGSNVVDPFPELAETRQVTASLPGVHVYQGDFLRVMQALDQFFRAYALSIGAAEQWYPSTVPLTSMAANGYLANFPHHALLVSALHADMDSLAAAAALAPNAAESSGLAGALDQPRQMLSPTVCYHCFESLRGTSVRQDGTIFTGTALCHRHEGKNIVGLERLQTFTMREIVFYGSPEFVEQMRLKIAEHCKAAMAEWDITCRLMTACDPFFAVAKETKRSFQSLMGLKYEMQLRLPHNDAWVSAASFNNHQHTLVGSYGITIDGGSKLHSGCIGYGLDRMAYALFAQFGMELSRWPAALQGMIAGAHAR